MSIPSITCTFIGDSGVGKSTLLEYENHHRLPTVGVNMVCYQGEHLLLKCWDTSGQNKFKSVVRMFANKCDVVVYVFDASSEVDGAVILAIHNANVLRIGSTIGHTQCNLVVSLEFH